MKTKSRSQHYPQCRQKQTTKRDVTAVRKKYDLAKDDQIISFVGRIGTEKNLVSSLNPSISSLRAKPHAKLILMAMAMTWKTIANQAAQSDYHDRMIFTGRIDPSQTRRVLPLT